MGNRLVKTIFTRCAGIYVCKLIYICDGQYRIETYLHGRYVDTHYVYGNEQEAESQYDVDCDEWANKDIDNGV